MHYYQQPRSQPKSISHSNRGRWLENVIIMSNNKYRSAGIADIRKVPTPVQITESLGKHVRGRKERGEWVDFAGILEGRSIVFDAKETTTKNLPLKNIHLHQYELLKSWHEKRGISFLLVFFRKLDKYYLLPFEALQEAWEGQKIGGAKSIPLKTFVERGTEVQTKDGYALHYLESFLGG